MTKSKTVSLREDVSKILALYIHEVDTSTKELVNYRAEMANMMLDQIISTVLERIPEKMKEPTKEEVQEVFSMNMGYVGKQEIEQAMRDEMQIWNQAIDETIKNIEGEE